MKSDRKQGAQDKQLKTSGSELKPFESLTARAAKTSIILGTMVPVTVKQTQRKLTVTLIDKKGRDFRI